MSGDTYNSVHEYLGYRVENLEKVYNVVKLDKYNGGFIKNLKIFKNNLPKLKNNLRIVSSLKIEYNLFSKKPELLGYSDYLNNQNRVSHNLKKAIINSIPKNRDNDVEDDNEKIISWITDFCDDNDLEIKFNHK